MPERLNGYPDGTFKPEANVTYAEALKMILCALGYKPETFRSIVWPTTWIAKAMELDITDGVTLAGAGAGLPANRADVARMVDNALTVPKLVQVGFGDEIKYVVSGTEGTGTKEQTLLGDLGFRKVEGRVTDIHLTKDTVDEGAVWIDSSVAADDGEYALPEGADPVSLLGLEVKVWADSDNNVGFWEVTTAAEDVIYDSVAGLVTDGVKLKVQDKAYYWAKDSSGIVAKVVRNFGSSDATEVVADDYGRFVLNEDGKIVFACVFDFKTATGAIRGGLVTEATSAKVKYRISTGSATEIRYANYDDGVHIFSAQLGTLKPEDVKADDVLYGWGKGTTELFLVVAGEKKEGTLEAASSTKVTVAGKSYTVPSTGATYSEDNDDTINPMGVPSTSLENLLGAGVAVVLDINGEVRHVRGSAVGVVAGVQFGIAVSGAAAGFDTPARIKVVTESGTAVYAFEDGGDYDEFVKENKADWDTAQLNRLVAFKLNADGEIADDQIAVYNPAVDFDELVAAGDGDTGTPVAWVSQYKVVTLSDSLSVDKDDDYLYEDVVGGNRVYVGASTALFNQILTDAAADVKDADVKAITWSDIESKNLSGASVVAVTKTTGLDAVAAYFAQGYSAVAENLYGVVLEDPWNTADGWKVKIDVFGEGEKEYVVKDAVKDLLAEGYAVTFGLDTAGKINKVVWALGGEVDQVSGSYVDVDGTWYRVADGAVMYELDTSKTPPVIKGSIGVGDLEVTDTVSFVLDSKGKIVALVKPDKMAPMVVTKLGTGAPYTLNDGGSADLVFSEAIEAASRTAIQTAIGASLTYAWSTDNKTLTITNNTGSAVTWSADVTCDVTDLAGNTAANLLLIDGAP